MIKRILILVCCLGMAGCMPHFKDVDSYNTEFRDTYSKPDSVFPMPQKGDPYTFGGIGDGSGGTIARQSYATDTMSADFRDATDTGKLGEIAKDRTATPDVPRFQDLPQGISNSSSGPPGIRLAPSGTTPSNQPPPKPGN